MHSQRQSQNKKVIDVVLSRRRALLHRGTLPRRPLAFVERYPIPHCPRCFSMSQTNQFPQTTCTVVLVVWESLRWPRCPHSSRGVRSMSHGVRSMSASLESSQCPQEMDLSKYWRMSQVSILLFAAKKSLLMETSGSR